MMTPLEISQYKIKWMSSENYYSVPVHIDFDSEARNWCKKFLEKHQWGVTRYTDLFEHTFHFENQLHQQSFLMELNNRFKGT